MSYSAFDRRTYNTRPWSMRKKYRVRKFKRHQARYNDQREH